MIKVLLVLGGICLILICILYISILYDNGELEKYFNKLKYNNKIRYLYRQYKELNIENTKVDLLMGLIQNYWFIIIEYELNKPTKTGKIILKKSLPKLYNLLKNYSEAKKFIKDDDFIKPTDFENIINNAIDDVIDTINKDISIIKSKKLIQITNIIKELHK